jgi:hypothetical protein
MPVKTSPMDSEHPKTPSWAFLAPDLVKNPKSYGLCHFSPSSSATYSPFCTCGPNEPSSRRFPVQKLSTRAPSEIGANCRSVSVTIAPQVGGVGRMGDHMSTSRAPKANCSLFKPGACQVEGACLCDRFQHKTHVHTIYRLQSGFQTPAHISKQWLHEMFV